MGGWEVEKARKKKIGKERKKVNGIKTKTAQQTHIFSFVHQTNDISGDNDAEAVIG